MAADRLSLWLEAFERERDRERGELARLLHDEAGGKLTAVGIELTLLRMDTPPAFAERLDSLERALEAAFTSVRAASLNVAPDLAERVSLAEAMARVAESAGRRYHGTLALSVDTEYRPDSDTARALVRIAESLLGFFTVEAGATSVDLDVEEGPLMRVRANIEIDRSQATPCLGLSLAKYWAAKTNLRFLFGKPSGGSTILVITK
ncbi:MAG: histidine kinase [Acidobacteriota bacterium]